MVKLTVTEVAFPDQTTHLFQNSTPTPPGYTGGVVACPGRGLTLDEEDRLCDQKLQFLIENFDGKLPDKFVVIDTSRTDPVVVTGSMNWSASGGNENDENTFIIHDAETAGAYLVAFQELYNALGDEAVCKAHRVYLPLVLNASLPDLPLPDGGVHIISILYDPPGDDVQGEYVTIWSLERDTVDMTGWPLPVEGSWEDPTDRPDPGPGWHAWWPPNVADFFVARNH